MYIYIYIYSLALCLKRHQSPWTPPGIGLNWLKYNDKTCSTVTGKCDASYTTITQKEFLNLLFQQVLKDSG